MSDVPPCPLCGGVTVALPPPHPSQSMLSDGRILPRSLHKVSCTACGATAHRKRLSEDGVRALYGEDYALAAAAPAADAARAALYASWIAAGLSSPSAVLEVGCGSGALLRRLASQWEATKFVGFDPAAPASDHPRIVLQRGFLETLEAETAHFDLIVAVNVIEHSHDPAVFLAALASRLSEHGTLAIVCPSASPPNVELLFYDHLWTLTPAALAAAGRGSGLAVVQHSPAPDGIGNFQMVWFRRGEAFSAPASGDLTSPRAAYMHAWRNLDKDLAARATGMLSIFGAGQAAALLRAYAPQTWHRAECLVLDDVREAWALDKPVRPYDNRTTSKDAILIATAARAQQAVAARLANDGYAPIRWDDLISH